VELTLTRNQNKEKLWTKNTCNNTKVHKIISHIISFGIPLQKLNSAQFLVLHIDFCLLFEYELPWYNIRAVRSTQCS